MLIHLENMTAPKGANDYVLQNLIMQALTQQKENIAGSSGIAQFGSNGLLIHKSFDVPYSNFYSLAYNHATETIEKTTDKVYSFDPMLCYYKNGRRQFIAQSVDVIDQPPVNTGNFIYRRKSINTPKDIYFKSFSGSFAHQGGASQRPLRPAGSRTEHNTVTSIGGASARIQNGATSNNASFRKGRYKVSWTFAHNGIYRISQGQKDAYRTRVWQDYDFYIKLGTEKITMLYLPFVQSDIKNTEEDLYYYTWSWAVPHWYDANYVFSGTPAGYVAPLQNNYGSRIVYLNSLDDIELNLHWTGGLSTTQRLEGGSNGRKPSDYATWAAKFFIEEI